jgi:hypothetical protein
MAAVNVGAFLEYSWPQGILRCTGALGQVGRTPATATAARSKVKLARKAQVDDQKEVDGDDRRWNSDVEAHSPCQKSLHNSGLSRAFRHSGIPGTHRPPLRWPKNSLLPCWLTLSGPPGVMPSQKSVFTEWSRST